jgi:hypothetical protein
MNIALADKNGDQFYIACVQRHANEDRFVAFGKKATKEGRLLSTGQGFEFADQKSAETKVRDLVKIKIRRRGWLPVGLENLPAPVVKFLEVPPEMQVSPEEMVLILHRTKQERYVIFSDVSGLEEYFDAGVEYIGYETDDPYLLKVFDRYGQLRNCMTTRMSSVNMSDRAIEMGAGK